MTKNKNTKKVKKGLYIPTKTYNTSDIMKNKPVTQVQVLASVRKPLPPPSRPFKDKRVTKESRKEWRKECW